MSEHCIIKADFSATRAIAGRKCLALTFEVPIEQADDVLAKLGGYPQPGQSRWCAIALLNEELGRDGVEAKSSVRAGIPNGEREVSDSAATTSSAEGAAHPKKWNELKRSQQAYLLCSDPEFAEYFGLDRWASSELITAKLKNHFRIVSRSELDGPDNHSRWDEFVALYHLHRERHK